MAHIFTPNRPENPNANDNVSGIPVFNPIPAEPAPVNPGTDPSPAGAASVSDSPATQASVEEALPEDTAAPAADKAPRKRGRPAKDADPKQEKASKKTRTVKKEVTSIHFASETIQRLRIMHVMKKVSIADIVSECCEDMLDRSYQCQDPACNCKFSISCNGDDVAPKPTRCPICGSDKPRQLKSGF